jgi:hypothetical protein
VLDDERQRQLHALRKDINPLQLRASIEQLITQLFNLPGAKEGVTEDVHETLGFWQTNLLPTPVELAYHDG